MPIGAQVDERVAEQARAGACIVNVGNQHTLGLLVRGEELERRILRTADGNLARQRTAAACSDLR